MKTRDQAFRGGVAAAALLLAALIFGFVMVPTGYAAPIDSLQQQTDQPPACQDCHADEYKLWQESTHATAASDPVFQAALGSDARPGVMYAVPHHGAGDGYG